METLMLPSPQDIVLGVSLDFSLRFNLSLRPFREHPCLRKGNEDKIQIKESISSSWTFYEVFLVLLDKQLALRDLPSTWDQVPWDCYL